MAYARYSNGCDWYIFWVASDASRREDERVAVWHAEHRVNGPEFSYAAVKDMIRRSDFGVVPGRNTSDDALLRVALTAFVEEVEREWADRG